MAKLKAGLLSLGARGTLGKAVTFQERSGVNFVRKTPIPQYRLSLAQFYQRWDYSDAIFFWNSRSDAQKAAYATLGSKMHLTAYAYCIRDYLRNLPDLVGRWHLDEGTGIVSRDTSKQGNDGVIVGATLTTGIIDNARAFDGINDRISIPHSVLFSRQVFTIELFVNIPALGWMSIYDKGNPEANNFGICMRFRNVPAVPFGVTTGTGVGWQEIAITTTMPLGQKVHMAFTYDNRAYEWFIQGLSIVSGNFVQDIVYDNSDQLLGIRKGLDNPLLGLEDEVRYYNRILAPAQILDHSERRYPVE